MLHACDVILALSNYNEGWNRIAAESMFLKKPVIGTSKGGLGELLIGGKQLVYKDGMNLEELVTKAYENKGFGEKGYNFIKKSGKGYWWWVV